MRPTARSDQVEPLIPWRPTNLNPHVGYPALRLPVRKVLADKHRDSLFALQILQSDSAEFVVETVAPVLGAHPLDAIEPLLEEIIRPRHKVLLLPSSQPVVNGPVGPRVITTQRRELGLVHYASNLVHQERFSVFALPGNRACRSFPHL